MAIFVLVSLRHTFCLPLLEREFKDFIHLHLGRWVLYLGPVQLLQQESVLRCFSTSTRFPQLAGWPTGPQAVQWRSCWGTSLRFPLPLGGQPVTRVFVFRCPSSPCNHWSIVYEQDFLYAYFFLPYVKRPGILWRAVRENAGMPHGVWFFGACLVASLAIQRTFVVSTQLRRDGAAYLTKSFVNIYR